MKVGFTCGSFDLLHAGHVMMLEEIAKQVDMLVVGLQVDPTIDRPNKNKPVQSLIEREAQLSAVRWVDKVIQYSTEDDLVTLLKLLKDDYDRTGDQLIRFIGADWKGKEYTGHDLDIPVVFNSRNHTFSSSDLRDRIVQQKQVMTVDSFVGDVIRDDDTYTVTDNSTLDNLVLSQTVLHPGKKTRGHSHKGHDEVYTFHSGVGLMKIDNATYHAHPGCIFTIRGGQFHQVENTGNEDLVFVCVFDKYDRNHV